MRQGFEIYFQGLSFGVLRRDEIQGSFPFAQDDDFKDKGFWVWFQSQFLVGIESRGKGNPPAKRISLRRRVVVVRWVRTAL
jgi:hypothetical protein